MIGIATILAVAPVTVGCSSTGDDTRGSDSASGAGSGERFVRESFDGGPFAGRTWLTDAPTDGGRGAPVVLVLHGGGDSALTTARGYPLARWQDVAARRAEGMVVVYPDGSKGTGGRQGWNDCRPDVDGIATDDVGFLVALAERMTTQRGTDPERVFVVGMSNGGMMTLRMAAERPDVVAGFGAIAANMPVGDCGRPTAPVAAVIVAGTADPLTPFSGGQVALDRGEVMSVPATVAAWRGVNRAHSASAPYRYPDLEPGDGPRRSSSTVSRVEYRGDETVTVVTVEGGGHTVPDRDLEDPLPRLLVGPQNRDVNAVDLIAAALGLTT